MYAYRSKITISKDRKLELRLPPDMPEGEAEIIVLANNVNTNKVKSESCDEIIKKIDTLIKTFPDVPHIPLPSLDRGELYK
ncbi:MAG: hypothetical protein KBG92_11475 [Spirochaetes bacterium]|jgi:hypothetical protein|nr:hypothetical protein [Spirochaetota bacterium]MBP8988417.1 hypothetical protein [Spirochaetota bacterium]HQQ51268.1 hypothetical protein [Spirochaetota bacterium]